MTTKDGSETPGAGDAAGAAGRAEDERGEPAAEASDAAPPAANGAEGSGAAGASDAAGSTAEERVEELEARLSEKEDEARLLRDGFLRARADLDNARKRAARERDEAAARILAETVAPFLDILDDLDRALAEGGAGRALAEGVSLIREKMSRLLAEQGVVAIDAEGARFDPRLHEAVGVLATGDAEPDVVLEVVRRGYRLGDRVLRPARVVVAAPASERMPGARDE